MTDEIKLNFCEYRFVQNLQVDFDPIVIFQ